MSPVQWLRWRLALAWHVLRGRPLIYRAHVTIHNPARARSEGLWIVECKMSDGEQ